MGEVRRKPLDYDARREPKTAQFCIRCQRDIKPLAAVRMIHIIDGGTNILHPDDEHLYKAEDGGDMGWFQVGPECAKLIGRDWTR